MSVDHTSSGDTADADIRALLGSLPEPNAPHGLFVRIEKTRRRRRYVRWAAGATASCALLALLLLPQWGTNGVMEAGDMLAEEQVVERPESNAGDAQLRLIDRQLQAAYERGAPAVQLQVLWQRREAVVITLQQETDRESTIVSL